MFKNDSQSIQQLLVAEKKAEEKVNQARKRKNLRLKQAKEEAHAEILCLKNEKETEFKDHEAKFLGSKETTELKIERDTERNLSELYEKSQQIFVVIKSLLRFHNYQQSCLEDRITIPIYLSTS
ncbi:hypothetical protein JTE90_000983 [Oedothorax gibbosus]|uniref:V-type proton ATPase subunit G n=1 Tax=Oedothorax gibbosus TaxID=931172 RepID=A0AAV6VBL0_9ARAC|nr:hypothetical protein JTE90_000983 [Oedothorax gibbosus]